MNTTGSRAHNSPAPWPDMPRPAMPVSRNFDEWNDELRNMWRDFRIQLDREFRKSNNSPFFRGMIMAWRRPLAEIPEGWHLANGEMGTVDLRGSFIKCVDADEEPGATGGSTLHAPAGTVAAPTFTGTEGTTSAESAGTPVGTFVGATTATTSISAGTPAGTNSAPALTMASYTPTGTNSAPTFTGDPVAAATTNAMPDLVAPDVTATGVSPVTTATGTVSAPTFTGTPAVLTGTVAAPVFTGSVLAAHAHDFTPTGTISGTKMPDHSHSFTPAGSNSAPSFTGAQANFEPPFYKLAFIEKL